MTVFFTALAPEAKVKSSRDPLGLLPVWSAVGRRLIGNVTTVSGDLRGWTTLLLCVGVVGQLEREGHVRTDDLESLRPPFFRIEQLCGYACEVSDSPTKPRGRQGMRRRLREHDEGARPLWLGTGPDQAVLVSQASAGVWGQILASARASALVEKERLALAPEALALWGALWWPRLKPHWPIVRKIVLGKRGFAPRGGADDQALVQTLATLLGPALLPGETELVRDHILYGAKGREGPQARFVELWREQGLPQDAGDIDLILLRGLSTAMREAGSADVAERLDDVVCAEQLLGPAERLFTWLRAQGKRPLEEVHQAVAKEWPSGLPGAAEATDPRVRTHAQAAYPKHGVADRLVALREAMVQGDAAAVVAEALALNQAVMAARQGAPWVTVEAGKLRVIFEEDKASLPSPPDALRRREHSYYLDPMRRLIKAWQEGQHVQA